jgi:hypothetical protein
VTREKLKDTRVLKLNNLATHVTRHFLVLENTSRILVLTSRTNGTVSNGNTVRSGLTTKTPSLHNTSETLTPGSTNDIDILANHEVTDIEAPASRENSIGRDLSVLEENLRVHPSFVKVAKHRLSSLLNFLVLATKLHTLLVLAVNTVLSADNLAIIEIQNSDDMLTTIVVSDAGHTGLCEKNTRTSGLRGPDASRSRKLIVLDENLTPSLTTSGRHRKAILTMLHTILDRNFRISINGSGSCLGREATSCELDNRGDVARNTVHL